MVQGQGELIAAQQRRLEAQVRHAEKTSQEKQEGNIYMATYEYDLYDSCVSHDILIHFDSQDIIKSRREDLFQMAADFRLRA